MCRIVHHIISSTSTSELSHQMHFSIFSIQVHGLPSSKISMLHMEFCIEKKVHQNIKMNMKYLWIVKYFLWTLNIKHCFVNVTLLSLIRIFYFSDVCGVWMICQIAMDKGISQYWHIFPFFLSPLTVKWERLTWLLRNHQRIKILIWN